MSRIILMAQVAGPAMRGGKLHMLAALVFQLLFVLAAPSSIPSQGLAGSGQAAARLKMPSGLPQKISRVCSVLELARMMVPSSTQPREFSTKDMALGLSRIPGKGLSEKTLPLDRAVANHLKVAEGLCPISKLGRSSIVAAADMNLAVLEQRKNDTAKLALLEQRKDDTAVATPPGNLSMTDGTHDPEALDAAAPTNSSLFYKVYGNGPQKVIMVMGLSASHAGWEYLLPFIASNGSKYQVGVFDNRGIGASLSPNGTEHYSMEIFAEDTMTLADHLGWENFHLVGFSMGGMISQMAASLFPHRLLSLALLSTSARKTISERIPPISELSSLLSWVMARSEEDKCEADLRMHFDDEYLKREFVSGATIKDFWKSVYLSERAEQQQGQSWAGFCGQLTALSNFVMQDANFDVIRTMMSGPILVMSGTKDRIIHPDSGRRLHSYIVKGAEASRIVSTKLKMVEAGHFLPIQKRREVAEALLELWEVACPACPEGERPEAGAAEEKKVMRLVDAVGKKLRLVGRMPQMLSALAGRASVEAHKRLQTADRSRGQEETGRDASSALSEGGEEDDGGEEEELAVAAELISRFGEAVVKLPSSSSSSSSEEEVMRVAEENKEVERGRMGASVRQVAIGGDWGAFEAEEGACAGGEGEAGARDGYEGRGGYEGEAGARREACEGGAAPDASPSPPASPHKVPGAASKDSLAASLWYGSASSNADKVPAQPPAKSLWYIS